MKRMYRKTAGWLLAGITVLMVTTACDELMDDLSEVQIKVPMQRQVFSLDSTLNFQKIAPVILYQYHVNINIDSLLNEQGVNMVSHAAISEVTLGMVEEGEWLLSYVKSAKVTVSDFEDFSDEVEVACTTSNIKPEANTVQLATHNLNIAQKMMQDGIFIRIYGVPSMPFKGNKKMFVKGMITLDLDSL
jgi:hypothetical protein